MKHKHRPFRHKLILCFLFPTHIARWPDVHTPTHECVPLRGSAIFAQKKTDLRISHSCGRVDEPGFPFAAARFRPAIARSRDPPRNAVAPNRRISCGAAPPPGLISLRSGPYDPDEAATVGDWDSSDRWAGRIVLSSCSRTGNAFRGRRFGDTCPTASAHRNAPTRCRPLPHLRRLESNSRNTTFSLIQRGRRWLIHMCRIEVLPR